MSHPIGSFMDVSRGLIRRKARRICRRRGFGASDMPCLEQEFWLHLCEHVGEYSPSLGAWEPWASVVLDRYAVTLWRKRNADMRSPLREACSLDEPVRDEDGREAARHETTNEVAEDLGRLRDLERDMAAVIARLPEHLLPVALALAFGTPHGVGEELGLSRRAVAAAIEQIREVFHDAGLDQYL